jgi:uncharacterized membrane protein
MKKHLEHKTKLKQIHNVVSDVLEDDDYISSKMIEVEQQEDLTLSQRLSDKVAEFGGSWKFIILFFLFVIGWTLINATFMNSNSFDPYPYILLNLVLACVASLQAPFIMMAQNRQEELDRKRARNDYMVNLKAEMEVRQLRQKLDEQMKFMLELQVKQTEILERLDANLNHKKLDSR